MKQAQLEQTNEFTKSINWLELMFYSTCRWAYVGNSWVQHTNQGPHNGLSVDVCMDVCMLVCAFFQVEITKYSVIKIYICFSAYMLKPLACLDIVQVLLVP